MKQHEEDYNRTRLVDMQTELEEFSPELKIDKYRLDDEIAKQADLYHRVSAGFAEAASWRDRAKHDLSMTEAEAAQFIRTSTEKATEAGVKEQLTLTKSVVNARRNYISWERVTEEWKGLQIAFDQKSKMLRDMSQLYVSGYFTVTATGKADDNAREARATVGRRQMAEARRERPVMRRS
jgi:hypothetical protein